MSPRGMFKVIDENTSVPLKVVVPVVLSVIGLVWWLSTQFGALDNRIARLEWKIDQIGARAAATSSEQHERGEP